MSKVEKVAQLKEEIGTWALDELIKFSTQAYELDYELGVEVAAQIRQRLYEVNLYGAKIAFH